MLIEDELGVDAPIEPAAFPHARLVPFVDFKDKYRGRTCYVVGRGPTSFDYEKLGAISDPIFFINDAVCLEKFARSETFFFAHDIQLRPWLDGSIKSTAVLPVNGTILGHAPGVVLEHPGQVVFYTMQLEEREALMGMNRDELAGAAALFGHSGTIHSVLHFAWYCGFGRVKLVGCGGTNPRETADPVCEKLDGYDGRLANRSGSLPSPHYATIRRVQDFLASFLKLEMEYVGAPTKGR